MTREVVTRLTAVSPGVLEGWNQTGPLFLCFNVVTRSIIETLYAI
jgi:hypothetical protein